MGKRVLLIEDEPNIVEAVRFILSRDGWAVDTQAQGDTALAGMRNRRPDVVILDVMLPGKGGFDVLRDIRASADLADLPILVLTAKGQSKDREMAERLGADRFMTKPFANEAVLAAVRDLGGS